MAQTGNVFEAKKGFRFEAMFSHRLLKNRTVRTIFLTLELASRIWNFFVHNVYDPGVPILFALFQQMQTARKSFDGSPRLAVCSLLLRRQILFAHVAVKNDFGLDPFSTGSSHT